MAGELVLGADGSMLFPGEEPTGVAALNQEGAEGCCDTIHPDPECLDSQWPSGFEFEFSERVPSQDQNCCYENLGTPYVYYCRKIWLMEEGHTIRSSHWSVNTWLSPDGQGGPPWCPACVSYDFDGVTFEAWTFGSGTIGDHCTEPCPNPVCPDGGDIWGFHSFNVRLRLSRTSHYAPPPYILSWEGMGIIDPIWGTSADVLWPVTPNRVCNPLASGGFGRLLEMGSTAWMEWESVLHPGNCDAGVYGHCDHSNGRVRRIRVRAIWGSDRPRVCYEQPCPWEFPVGYVQPLLDLPPGKRIATPVSPLSVTREAICRDCNEFGELDGGHDGCQKMTRDFAGGPRPAPCAWTNSCNQPTATCPLGRWPEQEI